MPLVILNIAVMDLVFSFDSILTAIGIARDLAVMVAAIMISIVIMFLAANAVASFIRQHPTSKVLALCFLVLIGLSLVAEGTGFDVPRGYLYFAMVFSGERRDAEHLGPAQPPPTARSRRGAPVAHRRAARAALEPVPFELSRVR